MTNTYSIFDGSKRTVVLADTVADAVAKAGYDANTMLEVVQVCWHCQSETKFYRNDVCFKCWCEMHD